MIKQALGRIVTASKAVTQAPYDCLDLLRSDHMKVEANLVRLRLMKIPERKRKLFREVRKEIENHIKLEENLFYPAAEEIPRITDLIDQCRSDHQLVKGVLKDLAVIETKTKRFDSLLTKLILKLEAHVRLEEEKVFPGVRKYMDATQFRQLNRDMLREHSELAERPSRRAA